MRKLVAIHQPNFFPWMGFFDKIRQADTFVFLDEVSYPRSGSGSMGSWSNRVKLNVQGVSKWITCPVRKAPLGTSINRVEIDDEKPWREKFRKTLAANYSKSPCFSEVTSFLEPLINLETRNLAEFNMIAVETIAERLGLQVAFERQSALNCLGAGTDLLISVTKSVGGNAYLAGGGAAGYQQDDLFGQNGIELVKQDFTPWRYCAPERFLPGLSIIDFLMHCDGRAITAPL